MSRPPTPTAELRRREVVRLPTTMLSKTSPEFKSKVRGLLGIGDVFLITKESENTSVTKYKKQAESEKARADALAQEVAELRKLAGSNGVQKGAGE